MTAAVLELKHEIKLDDDASDSVAAVLGEAEGSCVTGASVGVGLTGCAVWRTVGMAVGS